MFIWVNSLSFSHFSMVSGSLFLVPFPCSPVFPSIFISQKNSDKGKVIKENREDRGTVIIAILALSNAHLKGFVSLGSVDLLLGCVCVFDIL